MTNNEKPVVVGVDGSPSALHAVRWAAREAALRAVPLRLVHIGHLEPVRHPRQVSPPPEYHAAILEQGRHFLDEASEAARNTVPDLAVATDVHTGKVVDALVNESKHAVLMVLGSRGLGGFGSLLLGSVAVALSAHGHCPVVLVRAGHNTTEVPAVGPVVVGVDGTEASEAAVAFAFAEAAAQHAPLVAVHAYTESVLETALANDNASLDWTPQHQLGEQTLTEQLAGWQEKYPEVTVEREVVRNRPAEALRHRAQAARLVVVGRRRRSRFRDLVLGSTSQHLLHHATSPVAVVRADTAE